MAVRTARINTVSFSYSNVAKNGLVCKPGDVLTLVEGEGGQMYVDLATPESLIWGICDDKKVFPDTNETQELLRVNYTPIAWDNTYKMEVSGEGTPKVGYFYCMTDDQLIDLSTESKFVGQFMVQDINEAYIEVRFVCNQGLAVSQYEDVRLESIREANPESEPFDGQYVFVLSNGTEIQGDFSALAWYLGDVTITGQLTVEKGISVAENAEIAGNTTIGGTAEVAGKITGGEGAEITGDVSATGNLEIGGDVSVEGTTNLKDVNTENLNATGNTTLDGRVSITGDTDIAGNASIAQDINVGGNSKIEGDSTVEGNQTILGDSVIKGNTSYEGDVEHGGKTKFLDDVQIGGNLEVADDVEINGITRLKNAVEMKDSVEIDGSVDIGGSVAIHDGLEVLGHTKTNTLRAEEAVFDEVRINRSLDLGDEGVAPDFVLQKEKGQPNGVAPLDVNGKIPQEYLPDVYTTAIVKMGIGIFDNSDTAIVQDDAITASSYVNISNYSDIHGDLDEIINEGQITVVSNKTETGSFRYIVVNPIQ